MNIAILTSSYPRYPGDGTAPFIQSIAESYTKLGHKVEIVVPYDPLVKGNNDQTNLHVNWYKYAWPNSLNIIGHARSLKGDARLSFVSYLLLPLYLLMGIITLCRICKEKEIDVIHANWVLPNGPIALVTSSFLKIPYILSLHGSDIYVSKKNPLFSWVARLVFKNASSVTACSMDLKKAAIELGASKDTRLLAWGADPQRFSPDDYSLDHRMTLGVDNSGLLIVSVGRLVHKKGFDVLIDAWARISHQYPGSRLVIGGDGPLMSSLQAQAEKLGVNDSVSFPGRVNWKEVPQFLASADIFVLPSVKDVNGNMDGLPTVLLEAMSCGVAIIASDLGGVPLVIRNQENGILVNGGSVDDLTVALQRICNDPNLRKRMGTEARNSVVLDNNWLNVGRNLEALLLEAMKKKRNSRVKKRLGVIYRKEYVDLYLRDVSELQTDWVLDIGCYDGDSLKNIKINHHIGVDLSPVPIYEDIDYVKADGCNLPFVKDRFTSIFALDVIEHIENDQAFAHQLLDALAPGGRLILTTPNQSIHLYPSFLTKWISKQWGHHLRLGYTKDQLTQIFSSPDVILDVRPWNAYQYRFWYLLARLFLPIFPNLITNWVRRMAETDYYNQDGDHGFWIVDICKKPLV